MFNQVTYNVVIERLRAFAEGHYLIRKFTHGQISQTDLEQNQEFPWMHVDPIQVTPNAGVRTYQFEVTFADLPRDKETDAEYQKEAISDCIRLCEDLLAEIKNGHVIFPDADLEDGSTITPFIAEYTHTLSGASLNFQMTFPWNWSACEIPADWSVGGSGSGGGGGMPSALVLKVNGVNNVVQNVLDLVEGTGINITDNGDGSVTITNTGGGGGSVAWGAIVGTLSSQVDLQNALDLKADISSLASVATSGDYNDLINQPTIPTATSDLTNDSGFITIGDVPAQVNSDWNSVSGVSEILNKPTLAIVATSGDYNDLLNLPTIPAAQVNSDWNATSGVAEILNKPSLPATIGDMLKSVYDTDDDGVVDSAERVEIVVRNSTGVTLTKGQIVYLSGATGNRPNALLADADTEPTSSKTIGMVVADILNNADGNVAVNGTLHDIDTSSFTAGDTLWLSQTAGAMQANTPPSEPAHAVFIGYVARSHPNFGRIVLAIQNGYELNELHGVQVSGEANRQGLFYNSTSGLWVNRTIETADLPTGIDAANIGTGVVSNTEFGYLDGVTSAIQTQLNGTQEKLVSGTNIKTINLTTILGSGNFDLQDRLLSGTNIKTINSASVLGSGNLAVAAQDSISLINNTSVTLGVSTTSYVSFCAFTTNSTEANRQVIIPVAGTIKNLYVLTSTTQSAAGTQVCTCRKNGANTTIVATITAGAAAGTFSDTTNSVSVAAGDKLSLQVQNNAASGTAATIVSVAIIIERT